MAAAAALAMPQLGKAGARPLFEEIAPEASGIHWVHDNAASVEHYLPETMGPGCAFFDYDNDGWMDIFLVNSGPCDFYKPAKPIRSALYKNNRDGTFTDVTEKAGLTANTFGMGVAVGDFDNDGFPDLFVTAYGRPILYRNNGNGTFTDVSEKAGLGRKSSRITGAPARPGSISIMMASWICSSAVLSITEPPAISPAATTNWESTSTASPACLRGPPAFCSTIMETALLPK